MGHEHGHEHGGLITDLCCLLASHHNGMGLIEGGEYCGILCQNIDRCCLPYMMLRNGSNYIPLGPDF